MDNKDVNNIGFFNKYLTIWVFACMVVGVLIGVFIPVIPEILDKLTFFDISIPIAILIWVMIYPMMMKVDFNSIKKVGTNPKGLVVTWVVNWLIKPFTMYFITSFFMFVVFKSFITPNLATEYLAGAVLLGAAPCTAMVFVWSSLTKGNPAYTVVQVATNDLIILVAFVPIVKVLLGVSNVTVPYNTLIVSVILFVVIPLVAGIFTRIMVVKKKGVDYFENKFLHKFDSVTTIGLLLTLVIIFSSQASVILSNPVHIVLIAVPLIIQTFLIFFIAYGLCKVLGLTYDIAAPAGMIGASNFFELSVAVAIALFGTTSPAALATTVGVLTEVPVMLTLVKIANKTQNNFKSGKKNVAFICVHNSCRSQIAEALGRHFAGDVFESYSAGSEIKPSINQDALRLMKELYNIDMEESQYSKTIDDIPKMDIVISMGCYVNCPYVGKDFDENWGLEDPTGKSDEEFIKVIKEIEENIKGLKKKLEQK